jgi:Xaa-Pro aminopeptidase
VTGQDFLIRRRLVAADLAECRLDALIVSHGPNIRYLTGFSGSNALLFLSGDKSLLFTDPRYEIQAGEETTCKVRVAQGSLLTVLAKSIRRRSVRRIGFEKSCLSFGAYETLKKALPPGVSLTPSGGVVELRRMVKSEDEIALIRRSVLTNSRAFAGSIRYIRPGVRESDLAAHLEFRMRRLGAQAPAFEAIVAFGERSALPHARPTAKTLVNNQLLLIDMGANVDGYASDMTRMAFLGRPGPRVRRMYDAVLRAQLAAVSSVREGVTAEEVDRAARRVLKVEGLDRAFVHSTGHGLGLEIHELPRLGKGDRTFLKAGMAITIEPGVYLQGFGGIRIEDTVLVTRNGCDVLTPTSRELIVL